MLENPVQQLLSEQAETCETVSATALPEWHKPSVQRLEIKRTFNNSGSAYDGS